MSNDAHTVSSLDVIGIGNDGLSAAVNLLSERLCITAKSLLVFIVSENSRSVPYFTDHDFSQQFLETAYVVFIRMRKHEYRKIWFPVFLRQETHQFIDNRPCGVVFIIR